MRRNFLQSRIFAYLSAAFGIAAVTVLCASYSGHLNNTTTALALLLVVLFTASAYGSRPALFAAALGALAFDYYFLPPVGTFAIADVQNWIAFGALFATAATVGELSARAQRRAAYNRRLIEADLDPLVTIGRDGKITDLNDAAEALTGRRRAELIGTDICAYFTDPAQARAVHEEAFSKGSLRDCPLEIRRPDKTGLAVLYSACAYRDENGEIAGVLAAAHDISGRKRAAGEIRRLASFPQHSPLPIVEFDRSMNVRYLNPAMRTVLAGCRNADPRRFAPSA